MTKGVEGSIVARGCVVGDTTRGAPLVSATTGGNANDGAQSTAVMEVTRPPRIGPGRPRVRPAHVRGRSRQVVEDLGQGPQPHVGADGAPSLGERGPHFVDGRDDGGTAHAEPAGRHVVGTP